MPYLSERLTANGRSAFKQLGLGLSRLIRAVILLLWVFTLSYVALGALNGSIAEQLLARSEIPQFFPSFSLVATRGTPDKDGKVSCPPIDRLLGRFRAFQQNPPPVEPVLDIVLPGWASAIHPADGRCTIDQVQEIVSIYEQQFGRIAERLRSVARSEGADIKMILADTLILPLLKARTTVSPRTDFTMPPEVQDWLIRERARIKQDNQARSLVGTFLLLSTLGAFGALIFLMRDFITLKEEKNLSHYIFRPLLGIFLAVAVFVLDIFAHSIISSASVLEVRYEPLYVLALAAGLLSERAYDAIRGRADSALSKYAEQTETAEVTETAVVATTVRQQSITHQTGNDPSDVTR